MRYICRAIIIGLSIASLLATSVDAEIIANAREQFSDTQGRDDWFFGYYDRSEDLEEGGDGVYAPNKFTRFRRSTQWNFTFWDYDRGSSPFTEITSEYMLPNNWRGVEHYAVIRYESEETGKINISGFFDLQSNFGSDGTIGRIFNEGEEIYAERTEGDAVLIDVDTLVSRGDYIDFIVDYGSDYDGTSSQDQTLYDFIIDYLGPGLIGDFDENGELDLGDIDLLTQKSADGTNDRDFDLDGDNQVDVDDVINWVKEQKNTWIGDANLDGEFNSSDLVQVIGTGTYESQFFPGVWSSGDFNGDGRTNSTDLVLAIGDGGYENGPRGALAAAVPEPNSMILALGCLAGLGIIRRR